MHRFRGLRLPRISYLTDLEGDAGTWQRYVQISEVLEEGPDGSVHVKAGCHFVFGGDAVDHKSGSRQVLTELLSLRKRFPDQVHLLLGNRDINKLRLLVELGDKHLEAQPLRTHPGVYWLRDKPPHSVLTEAEVASNSAVTRLQWILRHTMGAADAFEACRDELNRNRAPAGLTSDTSGESGVSDEDVLESFRSMLLPGGLMFEYLQHGRVAVRIGTALFVHAGLPRSGSTWKPGWVPTWRDAGPHTEGLPLDVWIQALEDLRAGALSQCEAAHNEGCWGTSAWSTSGGYLCEQPGSALMQYGMRDMPDGSRQPSVVYNGWLNEEEYQPLQPDAATLAWLREGGVTHILTGHLPHGDAPLVIRLAEDLWAVLADTTYGSAVQWPHDAAATDDCTRARSAKAPGRGKSLCEVQLDEAGELRVHGFLSNGQPFEARQADRALGLSTTDRWRVKGRVGSKLLLCRNVRWDFENRFGDEADTELVN